MPQLLAWGGRAVHKFLAEKMSRWRMALKKKKKKKKKKKLLSLKKNKHNKKKKKRYV
eukprot:NODE_19549_length_838_cov_4.751055.p5 GENE.NODE_19549_length_838_cov_4.751055~~NODE_19549_length_838_cov_4.751055.p5  ORF type:complete len:57 (+),score=34.46 NODE_19549_length_838_cov_4.751055:552-722(+)